MSPPRSLLKGREIPVVPMRELVVFPQMVVPISADSDKLIKMVEEADSGNRLLFISCLKRPVVTPTEDDFHPVGTLARILQLLTLPDGSLRVIVEGRERGVIQRVTVRGGSQYAVIKPIAHAREKAGALDALDRTVRSSFEAYKKMSKQLAPDLLSAVGSAKDPDTLVDAIAGSVSFPRERKIQLLETVKTKERLEKLALLLASENEVLSLQKEIDRKVRRKMEKSQREYFLNEKLREINKELGKSEGDVDEAKELEERIRSHKPPDEIMDRVVKECRKLSKLQAISPESGVLRAYLEWLGDLPWSKKSSDIRDLKRAAQILDEDHYNMEKPKERILDFIAVRHLKENLKGPILCFVGPPGTGKTSLGKSVARALGREFVRVSLGGVRDEAEIRGHRKTYIGAMPGKIIQSMKRAAVLNPVFLLDEIDKLSSDYRGDPASGLLEVLDPEQNSNFVDHYIEVPFDLSEVMFITTANSVHTIPSALRDRMEVIEVPGYTEYEKLQIAKNFLIPKQREENGLAGCKITFWESALRKLIQEYTLESGVRGLEREIGNIIRKIARKGIIKGVIQLPAPKESQGDNSQSENETSGTSSVQGLSDFSYTVTPTRIVEHLGLERFRQPHVDNNQATPGVVHGLAWTEKGGTILTVESSVLNGTGDLTLTGSLGDVMKESAHAAYSFIRANAENFSIGDGFPKKLDIHIHVPEGAIPKDGPSAGVTMAVALLSALKKVPVRKGVAMTGEITLTGRLLAVGGIKEKVLATRRGELSTVLLPAENRRDIDELPKEVTSNLQFFFASSLEQAIDFLLPSLSTKRKSS